MTFIGISKNPLKRIYSVVLLFAPLLIAEAFLMVYVYTRTVNTRHGIAEAEKRTRELEQQNIELRNTLYALLDAERLRDMGRKAGFVSTVAPRYLETGTEPLATQL